MENVKFNYIKGKNFKCYTEDFGLDFVDGKLIIISGRNGKGKSTNFHALCVCLYGQTPDGLTITDCLNNRSMKNMELECSFDINDDKYVVRRYYKHKKFKDNLYLYKNNEDISRKTVTDTYKLIETILVPFDVFLNTVYFNQQVSNFFTMCTDSEKKEKLYAIMGISEFDGLYDKTKNAYKSFIESNSEDIKTAEALKTSISVYNDQISVEKLKLAEEEENHNERLISIKSKIAKIVDDGRLLKKDVDEYKIYENIDSIDLQIKSYEDEKNTIRLKHNNQSTDKQWELDNVISQLTQEQRDKIHDNSIFLLQKFDIEASELKAKNNDLNVELNNLKNKRANLEKDLNQNKLDTSKAIQDEIDKCENIIKSIGVEQSELKNNLELQGKEYTLKITEARSLKSDKMDELRNSRAENYSKISTYSEYIEQIKKYMDCECPTCKRMATKESIDNSIKMIDEYNNNIISLRVICDGIDRKIHEIDEERQKVINENKVLIDELKSKFDESKKEFQKRIDDVREKSGQTQQAINSGYHIAFEDFCCECEKIDKSIEQLKQEIYKNTSVLNTIKEKYTEEFDEIKSKIEKEYSEKIDILNNQLESELNSLRNIMNKEIDIVDEKLEKFKADSLKQIEKHNTYVELNNKLNNCIALHKSEQLNLKNEELWKPDETRLNNILNNIKNAEYNIEKLNEKNEQFNRESEIIEFWKTGFSDSGIPSMLIDSSLPLMNNTVSEILDILAPGKFSISFDTQSQTKSGQIREKFSINVLNNLNGADRQNKLSGGEKRIIDVSIMQALRRLSEYIHGKSFNVLLLDEVLDSLDTENSEIFCQYLKKISDNKCVVLITHNSATNSEADISLKL